MIAVYAGSFDPFTNGHMTILKQACELFNRVYLVFAVNPEKARRYNIEDMIGAVIKTLAEENIRNCIVKDTTGLIADFAKCHSAQYLVRGLRNTSDYLYEESIAKINAEINPALKTVYFRANDEVISSSMVYELCKHGKDVSTYVNKNVFPLLTK